MRFTLQRKQDISTNRLLQIFFVFLIVHTLVPRTPAYNSHPVLLGNSWGISKSLVLFFLHMDFNTYQTQAKTTFIASDKALERLILGLAGEAGEAAETYKKGLRGDDLDVDTRLKNELGDVLWYVALIADQIDADLSDIAQSNLDKLRDRADRAQLRGEGDDR